MSISYHALSLFYHARQKAVAYAANVSRRPQASLNEGAASGSDSEALTLARFQESFDSIYRELVDELNVVEEQIVNGSVEIVAVGKSRNKIKMQKEELARLLTQARSDAENSENWLTKYLPARG